MIDKCSRHNSLLRLLLPLHHRSARRGKTIGRLRVLASVVLGLIFVSVLYAIHESGQIHLLPVNVQLKSGDVVLLGSSTLRGRLLKLIEKESAYAHIGIVDIVGGERYIIHADPEYGCVRQNLSWYLAKNAVDAIAVMRPKVGNGESAVAFARRLVDLQVPFDNSFRYKQGKGVYCTELVLCAWEAAGVCILPNAKRGDRIRPSEVVLASILAMIWECPVSTIHENINDEQP